jgi:four helix bundle protein
MSDYRTLDVWKMAHAIALATYRITAEFPNHERFGLTSQTRRAVASIAMNIAEGAGRDSDPDFRRFMAIAKGSTNEVEYCLLLARDLGHLPEATFEEIGESLARTRSMLTRLRQSLGFGQGHSTGNGQRATGDGRRVTGDG